MFPLSALVVKPGRDQLRREYDSIIVETFTEVGQKRLRFSDARAKDL